MTDDKKTITRRDFIKGAALAALATSMGLSDTLLADEEKVEKLTRVVLIRNKAVLGPQREIDAEVIDRMINEALRTLFGNKTAQESWQQLFSSDDIVGIKSNVWGPLPTPGEVEQSLIKGLKSAGIDEKNIDADDRGVRDNPVFKKATALINVRPLRTHHWSGVGGCLKNPIMFSSTPWTYHPNSCADLARVWELPGVKGKVRLNILVLLTPLFHGIGAHHFDPQYTWEYNGILMGTDPVALDAVGVEILNAKRAEHFGRKEPITPPPHHIVFADTRHKLGVSDLRKIDLVKLGWKENILI